MDATLDHTMKLEQIMKPAPLTLKKIASVRDAGEVLPKGGFHFVPIVDLDGKTLLGRVTSTDLIRSLLDQF